MKVHRPKPLRQPAPRIPGLTRQMVKQHAARLYRDVLASHPLTEEEWRNVEVDLARKLERDWL